MSNPNQAPTADPNQARVERQLDTEQLHAQLGRIGLSRLLHPFKSARITATVLRRQIKGEYDPNAQVNEGHGMMPNGQPDPFYEPSVLEEARMSRQRERERQAAIKRANEFEDSLENGSTGRHNPFHDL